MRYPIDERPPAWPAFLHGRYEWLDSGDPDIARLHDEIAEGGKGLYVLWCPVRRKRVIVEAWESWTFPPVYRKPVVKDIVGEKVVLSKRLNPVQFTDIREGRLVAIAEIAVLDRALDADPRPLMDIKRGDRAANARYKYDKGASPVAHRKAELEHKVMDARRAEETRRSAELSRELAAMMVSTSGEFPQVPVAANLNGGS